MREYQSPCLVRSIHKVHQMRCLCLIALLALSPSSFAQDADYSLPQTAQDIQHRLGLIAQTPDDAAKLAHADTLHTLIVDAVNAVGSFDYAFEEIKNMGILTSPDKAFRLFNWNVSLADESHQYHCIILFDKSEGFRWEELIEAPANTPNLDKKFLTQNNWLGCLYYEIIPVKVRRKTKYTLLGWDGHTRQSTRKIIDVLDLDRGQIRFGANIFKGPKGNVKRHILEYSSEVMVSAKFEAKGERIVMDHLEPHDPNLTGIFAYYGPDMTFDAFVWEKNKWVWYRDVEARLNRGDIKAPYNDPRKRN